LENLFHLWSTLSSHLKTKKQQREGEGKKKKKYGGGKFGFTPAEVARYGRVGYKRKGACTGVVGGRGRLIVLTHLSQQQNNVGKKMEGFFGRKKKKKWCRGAKGSLSRHELFSVETVQGDRTG